MSRREIRELISKAIDPTRCLEAYDWTFTPNKDCGDGGRWSKTFSFIYPILVIETISKHKKIYLRDKLLVEVCFQQIYPRKVNLELKINLPISASFNYTSNSLYQREGMQCFCVRWILGSKTRFKTFLLLINFAKNLPKVFNSVETECFYGQSKQQQLKAILGRKLAKKTRQTFKRIFVKFCNLHL